MGLTRKGTIGLADYLSAAAIVPFVLTLFYTQYIMKCILTAVYYGVEEKAFTIGAVNYKYLSAFDATEGDSFYKILLYKRINNNDR